MRFPLTKRRTGDAGPHTTTMLAFIIIINNEFRNFAFQNLEFRRDFGILKNQIQVFILPKYRIKDFVTRKSWTKDFGFPLFFLIQEYCIPKPWIQEFSFPKSRIQDFGLQEDILRSSLREFKICQAEGNCYKVYLILFGVKGPGNITVGLCFRVDYEVLTSGSGWGFAWSVN